MYTNRCALLALLPQKLEDVNMAAFCRTIHRIHGVPKALLVYSIGMRRKSANIPDNGFLNDVEMILCPAPVRPEEPRRWPQVCHDSYWILLPASTDGGCCPYDLSREIILGTTIHSPTSQRSDDFLHVQSGEGEKTVACVW